VLKNVITSKYIHICNCIHSASLFLSPAHCEPVVSGLVTIGALCTGSGSINNCGQNLEVLSVKDYIIHPDFNDDTLDNDFLLVRLDGQSSITPVAIDDGSYSPNYTSESKLWAMGFGVMYYGGTITPNTLQHVEINYVEPTVCNNVYQSYGGVTDSMLCAGEYEKDGCQGDSGK
jgi:secreted trypsin-like serine protease